MHAIISNTFWTRATRVQKSITVCMWKRALGQGSRAAQKFGKWSGKKKPRIWLATFVEVYQIFSCIHCSFLIMCMTVVGMRHFPTKRVWSKHEMMWGGALLKVLWQCAWPESVVRQSLDQLDLLRRPWGYTTAIRYFFFYRLSSHYLCWRRPCPVQFIRSVVYRWKQTVNSVTHKKQLDSKKKHCWIIKM